MIDKTSYVAYNDCEGEFSLSIEAIEWLAERGVIGAQRLTQEMGESPNWGIDTTIIGLERHSSLLILCVKELGPDRVSSASSYIRIQKIRSDKYMIRNTAGIETVLTPEDIIWVEVN